MNINTSYSTNSNMRNPINYPIGIEITLQFNYSITCFSIALCKSEILAKSTSDSREPFDTRWKYGENKPIKKGVLPNFSYREKKNYLRLTEDRSSRVGIVLISRVSIFLSLLWRSFRDLVRMELNSKRQNRTKEKWELDELIKTWSMVIRRNREEELVLKLA